MKGVLLVNLGSPKSTDLQDVTDYLDEFLMDERVVDYPFWLRSLIVRGIILRNRPPKTQKNYKRIWWKEGSPLIVYTDRLRDKVAKNVDMPVAVAMRYAEPSLKTGIGELADQGVDDALIIPLFPQFAMATIESALVKAEKLVKQHFPQLKTSIIPPFYNRADYIEVLAKSIGEKLQGFDYDHFLFSYHGIPERHIRKSDVTDGHCKMDDQCCRTKSKAHEFCYRHQCFETSRLVAEKLGLKPDSYSVSFQSRLGPIPWLKPYTDKRIKELAQNGTKKLAIASPAFVADCLESIDELGREGRADFIKHGGQEFNLIPCLNTRQDWVNVLANWIDRWADHSQKVEV